MTAALITAIATAAWLPLAYAIGHDRGAKHAHQLHADHDRYETDLAATEKRVDAALTRLTRRKHP